MFVRRSTAQIRMELVSLRRKYPDQRILMNKADVSDRNVRVDPDEAHNFCYTVGELAVIDFRLTFGWSGSPGFWGVMAAAAEHAHCNTTIKTAQLLDEGIDMMAHVKIVNRWEEGKPTPVPDDAKSERTVGGGGVRPFLRHCIRGRLSTDAGTTFGPRYDCVNRFGLASLRPRGFIRAGGDRRHAAPSTQNEHRLEHNNRRPGIYHQLAHHENLVDTRKTRSHP